MIRSRKPAAIAWAALVAALFGVNVWRAATLPVTHDEALTYLRYVAAGWGAAFGHFDSNNHVFHTVLCKLIVDSLGLSLLSLRTAALLGTLLFLVLAARLAALVARGGIGSFVVFGLAAANPLVFLQLPLARGYSLALAFFLAGLLLLLPRGRAGAARPVEAAVAFAFSIAANLTLVFPCVAAMAAAALLRRLSPAPGSQPPSRRHRIALAAAGAAAAGLAVFVGHLLRRRFAWRAAGAGPLETLRALQKSNYYLGASTWGKSIRVLLVGSFGPAGEGRLAVGLVAAAACALAVVLAAVAGRGRRWTPSGRTAFLLGSALVGSAAILAVLHAAIGLPLPQARTGLAYAVLFPLVGAALIPLLPRRFRRIGVSLGILAGSAALAVYATVGARASWNAPDSVGMIDALQRRAGQSTPPWRVSASWIVAPNLEFSRRLVSAPSVAPIVYRAPICADDFDAFVLAGRDRSLAVGQSLEVIFVDRRSGAVVAISRRREAGAPSSAPCAPARIEENWPS